MSKAPRRISVVRIPRQVLNQIDFNDTHNDRQKNNEALSTRPPDQQRTSGVLSVEKEPIETTRTTSSAKINHQPIGVPPISGLQSLRSSDLDQSKSSITIRSQPTRIETWVKPSIDNRGRPHLNWQGTNEWHHSLCSLFDDFNLFCYACTCWCCFRHELSSMMKEHWCIWYLNCAPLMELRTKFRTQYAVQGSIVEDCCLTACCPLCVALQLASEARDYGHRVFT
ncbi:unnamed protein product [Adineta ricciae]|uniref:Uncharacterized protein n=1 Tax=Adineta ricciae TaxID=249248 RepID=A0A813XCF8_ADIRI|nr:unnamed protein product [Adineta ricciae]